MKKQNLWVTLYLAFNMEDNASRQPQQMIRIRNMVQEKAVHRRALVEHGSMKFIG